MSFNFHDVYHLFKIYNKNEEVISLNDVATLRSTYKAYLESELEKSASFKPQSLKLDGKWNDMVLPVSANATRNPDTGVSIDILKNVGRASVEVPEGFVSKIDSS